jgi:hypothetical protein
MIGALKCREETSTLALSRRRSTQDACPIAESIRPIGSAKGAVRTANPYRNYFAPHSVLREFSKVEPDGPGYGARTHVVRSAERGKKVI